MSFLYIPVSRGSNGSNTFVGVSALSSITTGENNSAFGSGSSSSLTTGNQNSSFGGASLAGSVDGFGNSAFGFWALKNSISDDANSAFGWFSLATLQGGNSNSSFGYESMAAMQTASGNSVFGYRAARLGLSLSNSCTFGALAMENASGATGAAAFGFESSRLNVSGNFYASFGFRSLQNATGSGNTAIGAYSGQLITTGQKNSILGSFDGNQGGLDIRTLSNYIVLSDGDGNPRLWSDNTGAIHIPGGTVFPSGTPNAILYLDGSGVVTSSTSLEYLPSITGASADPLVDISGTWNTSGAAGGIRLDVTDTASAAGALLMDLRVGGEARISVRKDGWLIFGTAGVASPTTAIRSQAGSILNFYTTSLSAPSIAHTSTSLFLRSNAASAGYYIGGSDDVCMIRDAANTLAQRNGVNPQAFRVYNTFTDASNYERGYIRWSGNQFQIGTERAGSGINRNLQIDSANEIYVGNAANAIYFSTGGSTKWRITTSAHFLPTADNSRDIGELSAKVRSIYMGNFIQMTEQTAPAAPAANSVRIYAEDDGAGKTRLMALFATGAAQQIAIEP
jgi:hypothetical protein